MEQARDKRVTPHSPDKSLNKLGAKEWKGKFKAGLLSTVPGFNALTGMYVNSIEKSALMRAKACGNSPRITIAK